MPMSSTSGVDQMEQIWIAFSERLRGYLRERVARPDDAEDVLQEVMVRLLRHRARLGQVESLGGWVWAIARSALADHHRAGGRTRTELIDVPDVRDASWDQQPEDVRAQLAGCVAPMLDTLSPSLRQAIELVEIDGMSQVAAADVLGLSVPAMKSRVQRGRAALADVMTRCCVIAQDGRRRVIEMTPRPRDGCVCSDVDATDQTSCMGAQAST